MKLRFSAKVNHEGHRWSVIPSMGRIWRPSTNSSGIWRNSEKSDQVLGYGRIDGCRFIDGPSYWIVDKFRDSPVPEGEEILIMERWKASTKCRCIDKSGCWSVDWFREEASWRMKKMLSLDGWRSQWYVISSMDRLWGLVNYNRVFWTIFLILILFNLGQCFL